jgi:phosphosulfolactate synthase
MSSPGFLALPCRTDKPRRHGITHVLDKGLPIDQAAGLLQVAGLYLDVWKLGWGTAYLDPGLPAKLAMLAEHGVLACLGGTLLEVAFGQGQVDAYLDWAQQVGVDCVEVSCGAVPMTRAQKDDLIDRAGRRFVVLAEVGAKDPEREPTPAQWAADAAADLAAGATWVVTEGRESGTVGLYDATGAVREEVLDAVTGAVDLDSLVFEAPRKDQQAFLIRRFGANVNLANVPPADALGVEALRLGLRADTLDHATVRPSAEAAVSEVS